MGFDAWFFARLDNADRDQRRASKSMEFIWEPNGDKDKSIFTHVLYNHYSAPQGLDFSAKPGQGGTESVFITNKKSFDYNAEEKAKTLLDELETRATVYQADDLFVVFGDDFKYINAHWYFEQLDKMIDYVNKK